MGGGRGTGLNFGATYGSGQLPIIYQTQAPKPQHHIVFEGCSTKLNEDKQGRHIPGHKKYQEGKSYLTISMEHAQELADEYGGTGRKINGQTREVVNFHEIIGVHIELGQKEGPPTQYGTIHYGKRGCHIVPANPNQD